ncbi:hypothetical protein R84B8_01970 [Treponema sp. R8-4-B8]
MDILIDTNVILDHLCSRQPYAANENFIVTVTKPGIIGKKKLHTKSTKVQRSQRE